MRSIGIRELRQNASKYLRLVRDGETIEVTDRGEPIATITPIRKGQESVLDRLRREGRIYLPEKLFDLSRIPMTSPDPDAPTFAEILEDSRADRG
jgi:prevent-host-death family protein